MAMPTPIARWSAPLLVLATLLLQPLSAASSDHHWADDSGKPAPELTAAGWIGTPVSLSALRGNTIVLAFWNADIPC